MGLDARKRIGVSPVCVRTTFTHRQAVATCFLYAGSCGVHLWGMNCHPGAVNFVRATPSVEMPGWRGVIRIRGWFDEDEGPLSADAVRFYKTGATVEDPTIGIA